MKSETYRQHNLWIRASLLLLAITILIMVYIFQRISLAGIMGFGAETLHPNVIFILNRTVRLIINDLACFLLIYVFFQEKKYLKLAFWVFLIELLVILPVYFAIKLSMEGDSEISSPLLSQVHRLVVNPTLMILLIIGFFYQRFILNRNSGTLNS